MHRASLFKSLRRCGVVELSATLVTVIGIVVSLLAQGIKLAGAKWGWKPNRVAITWISGGLALVLALMFGGAAFPAWPVLLPTGAPLDLVIVVLQWVGQVLVVLVAVVGFAKIIYDLVLMKLFEYLGLGESQQLKLIVSAQATRAEPPLPF
jgi:hypothetical protein